ncbi:MAG: hypothetical protein ACE5HS_18480 [bacterium]
MAYIPGFEFDLFISYAHVDNLADDDGARGWVEQFCNHLNIKLTKRFGREGLVNIWWDSALDGSQLFDKTIQDKIKGAALFLSLHSVGYRESDYCQNELKWFFQKANQESFRLKIGDRYRIINVLLNNIHHDQWPAEYSRTSGFPFHDAKNETDFGEPTQPGSQEFKQQLRALVDAIHKFIESFREQAASASSTAQTEAPSEPDEAFRVFLADTSDMRRKTFERTKNELEAQGVKVICGVPPPYEAETHAQTVSEEIKNAQLAVHLLDIYPGRPIEGETTKSYPQKQVELGIEYAKSQFIWVPDSFKLENIEEDEPYKNFVTSLENERTEKARFTFVQSRPDNLTHDILAKIEEIKLLKQKQQDPTDSTVFLDTHEVDELFSIDLYKYLREHKIRTYLNPQEEEPKKNMHEFEERLEKVNSLLIIYGEVVKDWVIERLHAALELINSKNYPVTSYGIYLAPPKKEISEFQFYEKMHHVKIFDNSNAKTFNPKLLDNFLQSLSAGAGGAA